MRSPFERISLFARLAKSRGSWARYALLGGLSVSTVGVSFYVSYRQMRLSDALLTLHQAWSDRQARYGRIGQLVTAISDPSNEVFDSEELEAETARSQQARAAFDAEMKAARFELKQVGRGASSSVILKDLDAVEQATDSMTDIVDRTFASFNAGGMPPDVAELNGQLARIDDELNRTRRHSREWQGLESKQLLDSSTFVQRLGSAIPVLVWALVVVIALAVRRMALRAVAAVRESERILAARESVPARMPLDLDVAPDPVITMDAEGRITGWNALADEAFGRSFEEMRGFRFTEAILAPSHRDAIDEGLRSYLETDDKSILNRRLDITALDREGREFPIELAIVPARAGDATIFTAFLRDLTERRRADDQLQRLSLVASKATNGVLITDALGQTEWVNDAFVRITGHVLADLEGKTPDEVLAGPSTDPDARERMAEAFRSGTASRVELASQTSDGGLCWLEIDATPIFDDEGMLSQFVTIVTDVSERKQVEATLRESEARTRAILEGAVDGIVTIDDRGIVTTVNPASERIFGYRAGDLIGKHIRTVMPSLDDRGLRQGSGGESETDSRSVPNGGRELEGRHRNGTAFPIEISVSEVMVDGRPMWTGIVRDITQRKLAEAWQAGQGRVRQLLASGSPLAEVLAELVRIVEEQLPGAVCMIPILDPGQTHLLIGASPSLPDDLARAVEEIGIELGPSACSWGVAACLGEREIVEDTAVHPTWTDFRGLAFDHGLRSCWAEPILSTSGEALGAFVAFRRRVHSPSPTELELASSAAQLAGSAIERSQVNEALKAYTLELEEAGNRALDEAGHLRLAALLHAAV